MKEEIEQFKTNGNTSFTQKEMVMYLVSKIDKLYDKFEEGSGKISDNRTNIASNRSSIVAIWKVFTIIFTVLGLAVSVIAAMK